MKSVQKGFTLIEVCLVMLIFGVAVSSLMALFPVSLRQGSQAVSDSVVAAFGDHVMNALAGKASSMQGEDDWSLWEDEGKFKSALIKDLKIDTSGNSLLGNDALHADGQVHKVSDYLGLAQKSRNGKSGQISIRYMLQIDEVKNPEDFDKRLYRAILRVTDNPSLALVKTVDGKKEYNGMVFVTYFAYLGEVP